MLAKPENTVSNFCAYFPIFVDEKEYGISRDALYEKLKTKGIYGRRYFYPLISEFSMYESYDSANPAKLIKCEKNIARSNMLADIS